MELVKRAWKDPVWSKVISAAIILVIAWIAQHFFGSTEETAYHKAFTPLQLPHWLDRR
ncbi:hypothetical protein [Paraburkholderia sp. GAS32]|uniref:hypothetical protein n=1 Tax=Paraburkholderia sp. GAS32 TaxID=3035129 RepID=UPI003D211002